MQQNLTEGNIFRGLLKFSVPYLITCFLQTFYGMADLLITGQFYGASTISAVSIGSSVMNMVTVVIAGLAMGATVLIGKNIGAGRKEDVQKDIGTSICLFLIVAAIITAILLVSIRGMVFVMRVPEEAKPATFHYLFICYLGVPFITAYNMLSAIFRGLGDTKSPMYFAFAAGIINIFGDLFLIGYVGLGAAGAATATVCSQAGSVLFAILFLKKKRNYIQVRRKDLKLDSSLIRNIFSVGVPIAFQDGCIQVSFLIITIIANTRGVDISAAVGIVEKIIGFLFLVPSAMQASVTAISAQNIGAGKDSRALSTLKYAIAVCCTYSIVIITVCEAFAYPVIRLFTKDQEVVALGVQYFRTYLADTFFAGFHFCFSGYFCAYNKAIYSFLHNIASILVIRIPGSILATILFPATLYAMGCAPAGGSLLSTIICLILYFHGKKRGYWTGAKSMVQSNA